MQRIRESRPRDRRRRDRQALEPPLAPRTDGLRDRGQRLNQQLSELLAELEHVLDDARKDV